jgi:hypothetical protein
VGPRETTKNADSNFRITRLLDAVL